MCVTNNAFMYVIILVLASTSTLQQHDVADVIVTHPGVLHVFTPTACSSGQR